MEKVATQTEHPYVKCLEPGVSQIVSEFGVFAQTEQKGRICVSRIP